jgi:sulfite exporter TauE/SafE
MNTFTFSMAFLMGLTGSLHCAGMCGPIMLIMPFQAFPGFKKAFAIALYHLGRISVYALLAIILHSFRGFFDPKAQQYISIALGTVLLLIGLFAFVPGPLVKFRVPWTDVVTKQLGRMIAKPGLSTIATAGILNGLLPCGLVYMALSASVIATTTVQSAASMYIFGLGTLPMLIGITVIKNRVRFLHANHFKKLVPVIVFSFGCLFVIRGMNLGIPYLSPKIVVSQHAVKASCCHKNSSY